MDGLIYSWGMTASEREHQSREMTTTSGSEAGGLPRPWCCGRGMMASRVRGRGMTVTAGSETRE